MFQSQQILWYNVGQWGQLGYAVPNFGQNATTLNDTIAQLVQVTGRNLFAIMHHSDSDLRTPPSINTLTRVHKLIVRARSILYNRALKAATPRMEPTKVSPAPQPFLIFPVPYWQVRNSYLREWCGLILQGLGEAMQHSENRIQFEITDSFAGLVGQYLQRIYVRMATELFGVDIKTASDPAFTLSDAQLASYDPTKWFTSTELIDTVPSLTQIPTAEDLLVLSDGIPASLLVGLTTYPGLAPAGATSAAPATGAGASASTGSFAKPPSP